MLIWRQDLICFVRTSYLVLPCGTGHATEIECCWQQGHQLVKEPMWRGAEDLPELWKLSLSWEGAPQRSQIG